MTGLEFEILHVGRIYFRSCVQKWLSELFPPIEVHTYIFITIFVKYKLPLTASFYINSQIDSVNYDKLYTVGELKDLTLHRACGVKLP